MFKISASVDQKAAFLPSVSGKGPDGIEGLLLVTYGMVSMRKGEVSLNNYVLKKHGRIGIQTVKVLVFQVSYKTETERCFWPFRTA